MLKNYSLLFVFILLSSCVIPGKFVEEEEATTLQSEVITAKELEERLGPPTQKIPKSADKVMWVYEGVIVGPGLINFVPWVNLLFSTREKECSKMTVLVDNKTGKLSGWEYEKIEDSDHYLNNDENCND